MVTESATQSDGSTSFLRAARAGNLDRVLEHLKNNIDINTSNANGLNALHLASKDGHVHVASELLRRGAIVDSATKKGNTALHIASLAGQEEIVKLLLQHSASVNVQSQNGFTPLYMAAQENHDTVVKLLLANGANQSLATEDGFTPLAVAMQQGHDKVVAVLLESDTRGKVRLPALHIAAKKDDVKAATLLLDNDHNPDVTSKSGFTPLHIASHYGNQSIANLLIQKGADVNFSAKHNISPLHVAAKWGKTNMVSLLLEKGANIEAKTRDGLTPLHCAARSGHEQVVDMLLERGAPISAKTKNGLAALHMAAQGEHVDAARILLYHRAPVDEVTIDYLTALHVAAHCGHVRVAKLLLDRNADANSRALNGFTPLHIACKKNRIKVVELLLRHGANIGATTESGLTPLHVAAFMGCMNIVIYLLQHDASPDVPTVRGETPLHLAARANQNDIIRILLRNGAQVDARAREQQTPLHIASRLGNVDIVMLLLQHGAQVDAVTKDMYTALHISAKEGQDEVAAVLIDNGTSLEATTKKGFTALHLAAKYGHAKVAQLLLQKEAHVDAQGKNGVTPLHVACHYDKQNVALMLLDKGASPHAIAKNGHTPLHIAARKNQMDIATTLLEYGAYPNAESKAGFTPLHLSSQEGHIELSNLLIEHKASINHPAKNGLTPTHLCAQEDNVDIADLLLRNGANIDMATKAGYTPLHIACHFGQANMARYLLQHGANVNAATAIGYTPLHQAAQQGHCHIVKLLLERNANANAITSNGQTPLNIAQRLGYISVLDSLKSVTNIDEMTQPPLEQKYRVVAPEAMHESFMSDSEDEGGDDNILPEQPYRYLTVDEMKSLGDDSLPIDVTRDERVDSNRMTQSTEFTMTTQQILEGTATSPYKTHPTMKSMLNNAFKSDIEQDEKRFVSFLVSFLVDARGGAMRGRRHSGVRMIIPSRSTCQPTRITCRYVKPQRTMHPPQLMEGEALTNRILELGPVATKFLTPVIFEVPHFASLRGKEREIIILRSDNGETWREHNIENSEEIIHDILQQCFEPEEIAQMEQQGNNHVCRFVTYDFPQYFAIVSRIRQEVHAIGPEGGMVSSTVVPQVQAVFPQGALTKKIKVGLQAQPVDPDLTAKLLGRGVAVSPIVTVEPRRRKFHKAITLSMPAPKAHSQGMINQYSGNTPTLRLLCSITGGPSRAQWEDVTGSTPLTFVNDCVSFTTTVSARFWLMDCRNISDATKMATELYKEIIHVPFIAKFVVFAKRIESYEARLRVFCMTDDHEDKTLEKLEWFTEVAKSRDVEVLEGKSQYIEMAGNLVPITKSGEQLHLPFKAFRENRLPFTVRVKDQHADIVGRILFMKEPKVVKGEPPQQPICILNIVLPEKIVPDTMTAFTEKIPTSYGISYANFNRHQNDHYIGDIRIVDLSNLLGKDWIKLAAELDISSEEIDEIISQNSDSIARQAQSMIRLYKDKPNYNIGILEVALSKIGRDDIMNKCKNRHLSHSQEFYDPAKTKSMEAIEKYIHEQNNEIRQLNESEEIKYSAEEKEVGESESEDESIKRTVAERREKIVKRLSIERQIPASSQKRELTREIIEIKRKSLIEDKKAMHESEIYMQLPADNSVKSSSILSEQVIKMKIGKTDSNQMHKPGADKLQYSKTQEQFDIIDNMKLEDLKTKGTIVSDSKKTIEEITESKKDIEKDKVFKEVTKTIVAHKTDDELHSEKSKSKITDILSEDSSGIKDKIKMFSQHETESVKRSTPSFKADKESDKKKMSPPSKIYTEHDILDMKRSEDLLMEKSSIIKDTKSFITDPIRQKLEEIPVTVHQIIEIKQMIPEVIEKNILKEEELIIKEVESKVEEKVSIKKETGDNQLITDISDGRVLTDVQSLSEEINTSKLQSGIVKEVELHKESIVLQPEKSIDLIETTPIVQKFAKISGEKVPSSITIETSTKTQDDIKSQQVESKATIETTPIVEEIMKITQTSKPLLYEEVESEQVPRKFLKETKPEEDELITKHVESKTVTIEIAADLENKPIIKQEDESKIIDTSFVTKEFFEIDESTKAIDIPVTSQQITIEKILPTSVEEIVFPTDALTFKERESKVEDKVQLDVGSKCIQVKASPKRENETDSFTIDTSFSEKESKVIEEKETVIIETTPIIKEFIEITKKDAPLQFENTKSSELPINFLKEIKSSDTKFISQLPDEEKETTILKEFAAISKEDELIDIQTLPKEIESFQIPSDAFDITIKQHEGIKTSSEGKPLVKEFVQISKETVIPLSKIPQLYTKPSQDIKPYEHKTHIERQIESMPVTKELVKIGESKRIKSSHLPIKILKESKTEDKKSSTISVDKTSPKKESIMTQEEKKVIDTIPVSTDIVQTSEDSSSKEVESSESSISFDNKEIEKLEASQEVSVIEDKEVLTETTDINISLKKDSTNQVIITPKEGTETISQNIIDDVRNEAELFIDNILIDSLQIISQQQESGEYSKASEASSIIKDKQYEMSLNDRSPTKTQSISEALYEEPIYSKSLTIDPSKQSIHQAEDLNIDEVLPTPKPRFIKTGSPTNLAKRTDESPTSESPVPKPRSQLKPMISYTNLAALDKQMDSTHTSEIQSEHTESYMLELEDQDYPQKTSFYIGEPSQIITSSEALQQDSKICSPISQKIDDGSSFYGSTSTLNSNITIIRNTQVLQAEENLASPVLKGPEEDEPLLIIDNTELSEEIIAKSFETPKELGIFVKPESKQREEKSSINSKQDELDEKIIIDKIEKSKKPETYMSSEIVRTDETPLMAFEQDDLDKKVMSAIITETKTFDDKRDDINQEKTKSIEVTEASLKPDLDISSSTSSHYKSFEKSVSRPLSSDIMSQIYSSEYQTAIDKDTTEFLSAMNSSEKTISSQDSIRSFDSHSDVSITSISIDVSELSETLVESAMEETEEITDPFETSTKDESKNIWNIPDYVITEKTTGSPVTLLRRSPEMTFKIKSEQKVITPQEYVLLEDKTQVYEEQFKDERIVSLFVDNLKKEVTSVDDYTENMQIESEEGQGIPIPLTQVKDSNIAKTLSEEAKYASSLSEGSVLSLSVSSTSNVETVVENIDNPLLQSIDTSSLTGFGGNLLHSDEYEDIPNVPMEDNNDVKEKTQSIVAEKDIQFELDEYDRYETEYSRQFRSPNDVVKRRKKSAKTPEKMVDEKDDLMSINIKSDSTSKGSLIEDLTSVPTTIEVSIDQQIKTSTQFSEDPAQFTKDSKLDERKLQEQKLQDTLKSKKLLEEEQSFQRIVQEEYKQKLAKLQDPDSKDSSSDDRKADSPDSFEMVEQPDISDEFIIIEEVAKEANEDELGGKSIRIKQAKYEAKHDEEVEKIIIKSAPADPKLGSQMYKDDMNFEFEESPPNAPGEESSNGESKEDDNNSKEDLTSMNRRWVEMQLTDNQLRYPYELTGGILEDIKEEDAEFEAGSSRINSFKESFSSTPDCDTIAARRHHPRAEHDDISMNSLQEFESLEQAISLENRTRNYQGSTDSSSGSFTRRYIARHTNNAAQGDDVISLSSLKEFEGLESACIEAHLIEIKAKEEAALLSRSEESNTSNSNEDITKNKTLSPLKKETKIDQPLINADQCNTSSIEMTTISAKIDSSGDYVTSPSLIKSEQETKMEEHLTSLEECEKSSTETTETEIITTTTKVTPMKNVFGTDLDKPDTKSTDSKEE